MLCALWLQHSWFRGASTVLGMYLVVSLLHSLPVKITVFFLPPFLLFFPYYSVTLLHKLTLICSEPYRAGVLGSNWSALVNRHHRIAHQRKERVEEIFFDKTTSSSSSSPKRHRIDHQHHKDSRDYGTADRPEENDNVDEELRDIDTSNGQYDQQAEDNNIGVRTPTPVLLRRQHGASTSTSTGG